MRRSAMELNCRKRICATLTICVVSGCQAQTAAPAASRPPSRVGIIAFQKALVNTKDGQKAAADLTAKFAPTKSELERKQGTIAQLQDQLRQGSGTMSKKAKQELMREIDQATGSLNRETQDAQAALDQEQNRIVQDLGQRVMAVLDKYARDNGYTLILNVSAQETPVMFAANGTDITQDVIALCDKNSPPGTTPAKLAPPAAAPPARVGIIALQDTVNATQGGQKAAAGLRQFDPRKTNHEQSGITQETRGRMMAVMDLVDKYARDNGYTLILDVSSQQTPVVFAAARTDITQDIIALLDKRLPPATTPAKLAPPATPPPSRVGIIAFQKALVNTKDGQKAAADLTAKFAPTKSELERKQGAIAQLQDQLRKGSGTMSKKAEQELTREIDQATKSLNRETQDAQAALDQEQNRISQDLGQRIQAVMDKYVRDNGYTLILDVSTQETPVVFAANATDITQDVIAMYDRNSAPAATVAQAMAASNPDVHARDKDGRTALILGGSSDEIRSLIAAGADVNARANNGRTALMTAAEYGMADCIKILIASGALVDAKDNKGSTALMLVARSSQRLVNKGQNGKFTPVPGYSRERSASALIDAQADLKATDNDGATVLMGAVDDDCVRLLIARGVDVNARDHRGRTAIMHLASSATNPAIVSLLVAAGADVNARDNEGRTALMLASTFVSEWPRSITAPDGHVTGIAGWDRQVGKPELVTALIANGADVGAKDNAGNSVMSLARSAKSDCVKILRAAHAQ